MHVVGHERQELDRAHDRRAARGARRARRAPSSRRTSRRSPSASASATRTSRPGAFGAAVQRAAARGGQGRPHAGRRRPRHAVRAADRRGASTSWPAAGVEVAVVEAGLGGRHDATNVLARRVVVLTNVGLEHTRWLGPDGGRHRAREARGACAPGATLVLGEAGRGRRALAERRRAAARGSCAPAPTPASPRRPLPRLPARATSRVARAAAAALLGRARRRRACAAVGRAPSQVPGPLPGRRRAAR